METYIYMGNLCKSIQLYDKVYLGILTIICVFFYITLTSMNLLPSQINSISFRLISMKKNLAFSGSASFSMNS